MWFTLLSFRKYPCWTLTDNDFWPWFCCITNSSEISLRLANSHQQDYFNHLSKVIIWVSFHIYYIYIYYTPSTVSSFGLENPSAQYAHSFVIGKHGYVIFIFAFLICLQVPIFIPVVFCIMCFFMVFMSLYSDPVNTGIGFAISLTGIPAYYIFIYFDHKPKWLQRALGK